MDKLIAEGGALVTTDQCDVMEIADAQATGRFAANDDGIGFVLRPKEWLIKTREAMLDRKRIDHLAQSIMACPHTEIYYDEMNESEPWAMDVEGCDFVYFRAATFRDMVDQSISFDASGEDFEVWQSMKEKNVSPDSLKNIEHAKGTDLIAAERERQIAVEGWSAAHDDKHDCREMSIAAEDYLMVYNAGEGGDNDFSMASRQWPWDAKWWKPSPDPLRNLVKAGALIAAEIDRINRQSSKS